MCKLLLCFAQSSYYFRIGFAMDLCQEDIKDLCFGMHLDLYVRMHYALCTAREKPLLERRPEKPGRGEWVRDQDALQRNSGASPD